MGKKKHQANNHFNHSFLSNTQLLSIKLLINLLNGSEMALWMRNRGGCASIVDLRLSESKSRKTTSIDLIVIKLNLNLKLTYKCRQASSLPPISTCTAVVSHYLLPNLSVEGYKLIETTEKCKCSPVSYLSDRLVSP